MICAVEPFSLSFIVFKRGFRAPLSQSVRRTVLGRGVLQKALLDPCCIHDRRQKGMFSGSNVSRKSTATNVGVVPEADWKQTRAFKQHVGRYFDADQ